MKTRRGFIGALAVGLLVALPGSGGAQTTYKIGMSIPVTGADADSSDAMVKGAQMAIDEINQKGGVAGHKLELWVLDSATPAAGQYDPAQAATNYRKFIADGGVVGAIGTMMSGGGVGIGDGTTTIGGGVAPPPPAGGAATIPPTTPAAAAAAAMTVMMPTASPEAVTAAKPAGARIDAPVAAEKTVTGPAGPIAAILRSPHSDLS